MDADSPPIRIVRRAPRTAAARQVAALRRQGRQLAKAIADYPNVAGLTIGIKRVGGQPTGEIALMAYVTRKGDMSRADTIPKTIAIDRRAGLPRRLRTDVTELLGPPRALAARAGDVIWSGDGDLGTTCLTFVKNGRGYIATNAHVVSNVALGRFFEPNVMRPAGHASPLTLGRMAYLSRFRPGADTREDLAIIETTREMVVHLGIVGEPFPIARIDSFDTDLDATYWYSANGMRVTCHWPEPTLDGVPTPMLVDGIWYPYARFWMLQVGSGMVAPGHSGAVICRGSGNDISACGILFGGVLPNIAYAFQLQPTFRRAYDLV